MTDDLRHPLFARFYPRVEASLAKIGGAEHRDELLAGVRGRVLELGAGHGANFPHYPESVTELVAIEPEPSLRAAAVAAGASARIPVTVRAGVAERLDLEDASFDVAVASLVLCTVRDPVRALAELRRVLRPGGELRYYEHVRATTPKMVAFQKYADVIWPYVSGGCHVSRPTGELIARSGFTVRRERRFDFPPSKVRNPAAPHVIGLAVRD